ncbi:AAA family ATPase [Moraxellaceae bacterium AER2_44_116]|nr:AAA family ATPase [Moraxellaceae bacterium]TQC99208.1 AAA family ATPase [Moraxellaceae bacterium AER2_44_116]
MTKHLDSLKIQNFRMLEDFEVEKLGQVNLIVGKNNSGKSTVLEALRIYAGNADRWLLQKIWQERGERFTASKHEGKNIDDFIFFADFFHNRVVTDFTQFSIGSINSDPVNFQISHIDAYKKHHASYPADEIIETAIQHKPLNKRIYVATKHEAYSVMFFDYSDDEQISIMSVSTGFWSSIPISLVGTQLTDIKELAQKWDSIVFTDFEQTVTEALRIIEPTIQGVAFIQDKNKVTGERTAIVRLQGQAQPVPLKSLGDGMQRILQIALNIYQAKDGFLLIDEFENGLHYSVQEKVWGLIFEMAKRLNIQVFATTHSWDCIEAFSEVASKREDVEGLLFSMGRSAKTSDNGKIIATIFDEAKLQRFTQADMDVR